jgi:uncharacterized protein YdaU (DUF1376 family)
MTDLSALRAPLVPPETDLRDLDGFMLNVERMLASELWALSTPEEFKAAFALWMRAWKQFPAGSLPNDETVIGAFSGAGKRWPKVRSIAMRGFVLCSDNRWYHKTLCEDVIRAARKKAERHERTMAATAARKAKRHVDRNEERDVDRDGQLNHQRDVAAKHNVTRSQGQGQGQGHKEESRIVSPLSNPPARSKRCVRVTEAFDEAIRNLWPADIRIRSTMASDATAAQWLDSGLDVPEIVEMIRLKLEQHRDRGKTAPGSLSFLSHSAADLAATKRGLPVAPRGNGHQPEQLTAEQIEKSRRREQVRLAIFWREGQVWMDKGPDPTVRGCRLDADLIEYANGRAPPPNDYDITCTGNTKALAERIGA